MIVNTLIQPIEARFIRIYPETWHGHMSMRMELYGCEVKSGRVTQFDYLITNASRNCETFIKIS